MTYEQSLHIVVSDSQVKQSDLLGLSSSDLNSESCTEGKALVNRKSRGCRQVLRSTEGTSE